jgi:DUF1009 family protein
MARIGLVAGGGKLPMVFLKAAKDRGDEVVAFGMKGVTDPELEKSADKMHWLVWGDLKKAMMLLITERIKGIVLLGKIKKETVFKEVGRLDDEAKKLIRGPVDKKDYAILKGVADVLKKVGIEVIEPTAYLKDLIPSKGVLTRRKPSASEAGDIDYGFKIAKELSGMDIGQSIAVKDRSVIAVEAVEGTDDMISRAGGLVDGAFTVVKVARPDQDMRFDIPLVGPDTLQSMKKAGASVLALEAAKTLLMDREELIRFADSSSISVVIV